MKISFNKGIAWLPVLVIAAVLIIGGAEYLYYNPLSTPVPVSNIAVQNNGVASTTVGEKSHASIPVHAISWSLADGGSNMPPPARTGVTITIDGKSTYVGSFQGACREVVSGGGILGDSLLPGEIAAMQCYFAGGGDEIGVFENEHGGVVIKTGQLDEPTAQSQAFRGNFKVFTSPVSDSSSTQKTHVGFKINQSSPAQGVVVIGTDGKLAGTISITGWMIRDTKSGKSYTLGKVDGKDIVLQNYPKTPSEVYVSAEGLPANSKLQQPGGTEDPSDVLKYIVYLGAPKTSWGDNGTLQLLDATGYVVSTYQDPYYQIQ
jgi:hypothetical protein